MCTSEIVLYLNSKYVTRMVTMHRSLNLPCANLNSLCTHEHRPIYIRYFGRVPPVVTEGRADDLSLKNNS